MKLLLSLKKIGIFNVKLETIKIKFWKPNQG
ncbi:hypothetical protein N288_18920 [Bacillus infantis NRRL B-14911]|uniref:Uncharacterized protein n=1 Tax=Bacillus infantis NRRL B-14911 TaxID=1367477 RepID=U5LGD7_9BACI|nr:hypothetical protein N288_18920 [Bacillus infantis NRRL B-14911]